MPSNKAVILIVDDEKLNIKILRHNLQDDYDLIIAKSGQQALQRLKDNTIDLILLDIIMPELDGFEVCKIIKKQPETTHIPIIFLTAKSAEEDIINGFELGGVDYVTKPFNFTELKARIKTHIDLKKHEVEILRKHSESRELLHILCHDLANSIGNSRTILELIQKNPNLTDKMLSACIMANTTAINIIELVRKLRVLEETKQELQLESLNLNDLIIASQGILENQFKTKNIALKIEIPKDITIKTEKTSFINSVINNLLTNAIKFSHPNQSIEVKGKRRGENVEVSIKDNGIGMPESILNDLFDVSKKTSRQGTSGETGTGFGMPLVKKFIKTYGGQIVVNSTQQSDTTPDHGTEIILTLNT